MKTLKRILICIGVFILLSLCITTITGTNYVYKAIWYNYADLDDYKIFKNRNVDAGKPQPIFNSTSYNKQKLPADLRSELEKIKTVSLLVLKNDSAVYEEYWDNYTDSSLSNSFSVAKSIISILTGIAIDEGKIKSLDEPVADFLPEFKEGEKAKVTIRNLLTMSSGTNWDESYASPFSNTTEAYYGTDLYSLVTRCKIKKTPGSEFRYKSGDTELMGLILEKATGKNLSDYASEKLWKPLGAAHTAQWSLDKTNGHEKAYCCFNTNARDFSRIGSLYLHGGNWKGKQIVDSAFVKESLTPSLINNEEGKPCTYYGFFWWLLDDKPGIFYARGILGQYIICIPEKNIVIVRLGNKRGDEENHSYHEVYSMIDWAMKTF